MRHIGLIICLFSSLALMGPGCQMKRAPTDPHAVQPITPIVPRKEPAAVALPQGFGHRATKYDDGREVTWTVARFEPDRWSWRMFNDPSHPQDVKAWRERQQTDLAINGVYFDEQYRPVGFYSQPFTPYATDTRAWPSEEEQKQENGYTGLVTIRADRLYLFYLPDKPQAKPADDSFLTYPTLMADGRPLVKEDSRKYARRTILAQDASGTTFIISTEQGAVSLYEAAVWLAQQPERIRIALNLDGGPSTGLSYRSGQEHFDIPSVPVPNVITATKKQE